MSDDERRLYFSNSDFEKVAADIISSPRRLKQNDSIDALFRINEKQQEYYTKCFRHLIKTTQGVVDMNSAICGADQRIVAFFKRSSLDVASLSKIWSLADVNEDGYLDMAEFSIAMHLVVLRVKGEIPIPDVLPQFAKPPLTPPRGGSRDSQCSGNASISNALSNPESQWEQETLSLATSKEMKGTEERVNAQPIIKQFSNTPPLLVDSRPTAIKHSALLALKSPSGPPPIPPQRPQQRGHARSASLDLKLIALNNGRITAADPTTKTLLPPSSLALWSSNSDPPHSIVDIGSPGSNLLTTATSLASSPPSTQPPSVSTTTTTFASFPGTPDSLPVPNQSIQMHNRTQNQPPPIPQRISPSPIPKPIIPTSSIGTQTEFKVYGEDEVNQFFQGFGAQLDNLLGEEVASTEEKGLERWSKRCIALRQQNSELEAERARLAQVRIQLEIRLQEIEERPKNPSSSSTL